MADDRIFHRYDGFPSPNSRTSVPRISEAEAMKLTSGYVVADERGTTARNYSIREYFNPDSNDRLWFGGDFSGW